MTKEKELELLRAKHKKDDRIFFTIIIIFLVIYWINEGLSYMVPNLRFKDKVEDYLIRNYHYVYELEYVDMYYGTIYEEIISIDGASCECPTGTDKAIEQYVFSYKITPNSNEVFYVTYENNIRNRTVRIYDSSKFGDESEYEREAVFDYIDFENQRNEVSKFIADNYVVGYSANLINIDNGFNISTRQSLQNELTNNFEEFSKLYNSTVETLKGKDSRLYVVITFSDMTIKITNQSETITETTRSKVFN